MLIAYAWIASQHIFAHLIGGHSKQKINNSNHPRLQIGNHPAIYARAFEAPWNGAAKIDFLNYSGNNDDRFQINGGLNEPSERNAAVLLNYDRARRRYYRF